MKLSFESNLAYQQDAIKSITDLFEGQPPQESVQAFELHETGEFNFIQSVGNRLVLSDEQLLANLQKVQAANEIKPTEALAGRHFSVEMETGTGKTYVYLRTIYELNRLYGFKKFVIVVPSVAIREGVKKNLEITQAHFQTLYDNVPVHFKVYDSGKVSMLRGFATSNHIEILVINIDAFAKDENVINRENDRLNGQKPIEFIRAAQPIVVIDEPQNMETEKRIAAIEHLQPLCTLRYSATHKNVYNLTYSLNPLKAFELNLVKQIEVDGVLEENSYNDAFVALESITPTATKITAKLTIDVNDKDGVKRKTVQVRAGDNLYDVSNRREIYKSGFMVSCIDNTNKYVEFLNGQMLYVGSSQGGLTEKVQKAQIRRTIEEHLSKQKKLRNVGIKVLSLFFIDKVVNYRSYDAAGNVQQGKFAVWFEEIYKELIATPMFQDLDKFPVEKVHNGYFSQDKKGAFKDTSGETKADDDTYTLIMKDKERLLDLNNSLSFIFSHSALREGWDNPNVFQICTLNETKSVTKKRQEIGRGLRLAVNQKGVRVYDKNINCLTVIANECYQDFANTLQKEMQEECGVNFAGAIKNKKARTTVKYRKGFEMDALFLELWERIKKKTTYRVYYKTDELIVAAAEALKKLPSVIAPSVRSTKARLKITTSGIKTEYAADKIESYSGYQWKIPDVLGYIQDRTELTRHTIAQILLQSGKINEVLINPQQFLDVAVKTIKEILNNLMINGIKYKKIGTAEYEMTLFEAQELTIYKDDNNTFKVNNTDKTIYHNFIPLDSKVESQFAQDCESSEQVLFYFKLPFWFKIPTPIGSYNPDWALIFEEDKKIYFVAETKSTGKHEVEKSKLRSSEKMKIDCATAHFKEFEDVEYKVVSKVGQLVTAKER